MELCFISLFSFFVAYHFTKAVMALRTPHKDQQDAPYHRRRLD